MKQQAMCGIHSTECEDSLQRFTDRVNRYVGFSESPEVVELKSIERQVSKRMEPVRMFMESVKSLPVIGYVIKHFFQ
jgi:hypothetical protein